MSSAAPQWAQKRRPRFGPDSSCEVAACCVPGGAPIPRVLQHGVTAFSFWQQALALWCRGHYGCDPYVLVVIFASACHISWQQRRRLSSVALPREACHNYFLAAMSLLLTIAAFWYQARSQYARCPEQTAAICNWTAESLNFRERAVYV